MLVMLVPFLDSETGSLTVDKVVPDTITSWVATALSIHPTSGISVTPSSSEVGLAMLSVVLIYIFRPIE